MADAKLSAVLQNYLSSVEDYLHKKGDKKIYSYFFKQQYNHGCAAHPDIKEQQEISDELLHCIKENKLG